MARPIVTPFQVAEVNEELKAAGINSRVHLTDACGAQSLWIEMDPCVELEQTRTAVEAAFLTRGMKVEFDATGATFRLA
ncbi:RDAC family protein [Collinsella vaginalis]|uniref:RDAC family protein n=1 Tax=Collinsella vaginalis TaxID=1870987 RepID=UPI000A26B91A|nr:hypothetical protein [Collinsella vaginalis]